MGQIFSLRENKIEKKSDLLIFSNICKDITKKWSNGIISVSAPEYLDNEHIKILQKKGFSLSFTDIESTPDIKITNIEWNPKSKPLTYYDIIHP